MTNFAKAKCRTFRCSKNSSYAVRNRRRSCKFRKLEVANGTTQKVEVFYECYSANVN